MKKTLLTTILACCALIASAEEHTYTMSDYGKPSFTTSDGLFTTLGKKNDGASGPTYNGGATDLDVRLYAKNTYKITSNSGAKMVRITFCMSKNGHYKLAELTPSTGTMDAEPEQLTDANGWKAWRYSWTGNADEVTFTIGDSCAFGSECADHGKSAAGTLMFKTLIITDEAATALTATQHDGISLFAHNGTIYADGAADGTRIDVMSITGAHLLTATVNNGQIAAPLAAGIYIVKCAGSVKKVVMK